MQVGAYVKEKEITPGRKGYSDNNFLNCETHIVTVVFIFDLLTSLYCLICDFIACAWGYYYSNMWIMET